MWLLKCLLTNVFSFWQANVSRAYFAPVYLNSLLIWIRFQNPPNKFRVYSIGRASPESFQRFFVGIWF
jgi:hypothetical protein